MGELIDLNERRTRRAASAAAFFFDVACPLSYLAAERVERKLGAADWVPVDGAMLRESGAERYGIELRARAESYARELRLPLVWPDADPPDAEPLQRSRQRRPPQRRPPRAQRACAFACELGSGAAFALAACRLAFCGGFDLDDPETLAEAAAAAGVPLRACLDAAGQAWRDAELADGAALLRDQGIVDLPAVRLDGRWLDGEIALLAGSAPAAGRVRR